MKYLTIQGSSFRKLFCYCAICKEKHVWLRCYEVGKGTYMAICRKCKKDVALPNNEKSENQKTLFEVL
jgi:hypothetical protein